MVARKNFAQLAAADQSIDDRQGPMVRQWSTRSLPDALGASAAGWRALCIGF